MEILGTTKMSCVLYVCGGGGYTGVDMCQNLVKCTIQMGDFVVHE